MPNKSGNKPGGGAGLVLERQTARTAEPPLFQVILLNDDYTPMEFVVEVLQKFFGKSTDEAVAIMLQVHQKGRGVCGVYIQDIAATRVSQVVQHARDWQHPLQCLMEPVGD
jgi:ATP-dependent Clp protease adaptor protein ClpS